MLIKTPQRKLQILTNLYALLKELRISFENNQNNYNQSKENQIYKILNYIILNLESEVILNTLCERFFISKSQLCKFFKKYTGITVWDYITIKRLTNAQKMIKSGLSPTKINSQCGYSDYSVFYREYKKYFNRSPKVDYNK